MTSFDLKISLLVNQIPIWYANNPNNANSVIDLMFLWADLNKIDNHLILPESRSLSDYTSLTVDIYIDKEFIQEKRQIIIWNSKDEKKLLLNSWMLLAVLIL